MKGDTLDALFAPPPVDPDLQRRAKERGWPDDLLDRMVAVRWPTRGLAWRMFGAEGPHDEAPVVPRRPYTDLAYW